MAPAGGDGTQGDRLVVRRLAAHCAIQKVVDFSWSFATVQSEEARRIANAIARLPTSCGDRSIDEDVKSSTGDFMSTRALIWIFGAGVCIGSLLRPPSRNVRGAFRHLHHLSAAHLGSEAQQAVGPLRHHRSSALAGSSNTRANACASLRFSSRDLRRSSAAISCSRALGVFA